jgi:hypothetical protein
MSEVKAREFWLLFNRNSGDEDIWRSDEYPPNLAESCLIIHAIEHSAYAALQKENEELRERLQRYVTCPCCNESFSFENAMSEYQYKLDKENATLRECLKEATKDLEYIYKNCELCEYELVGGDGAPSGYLPYPHDMKFIAETLAKIKSKMGDV